MSSATVPRPGKRLSIMTTLFRRSRPGGDPAAALKREAQAWVVRLASGQASVADGEAFRRWCGQSAEHARAFKETRGAWQQLAQVARRVHRHGADDPAALVQRDRQQRPRIRLGSQDFTPGPRRKAGDLHHGVVLFRPDRAAGQVRLAGIQRRQRRRRALVLRVLPGFEADGAAAGRRRHRHVARRQDVRRRGAAVFVDQHAAFAGDAGLARQGVVGLHADPQHHRVGLQAAAVGQLGHAAALGPRMHRAQAGVQAQRHPLCGVQRRQVGRDAGRHAAGAQARRLFQHRGGATRLARGGGHLQADPAAAGDDNATAGAQAGAQAQGVIAGPQHMDGAAVGAGQGRHDGPAAGAQDQLVVVEHGAIGGLDLMAPGPQPGCRDAGPERDVQLGQLFAREQLGAFGRGLAAQHRLAQGRTLVGRMRLVAQQHDAAGVAVAAQRRRGPAARLPRADDDDGARAHAASGLR